MYEIEKTDDEWRAQLTASEYAVLRKAGTEPAYVGEYTDTKTVGVYSCRACDAELFRSDHKFDSHCGWPSFYMPTDEDAVELVADNSHGMRRTEARCRRCGSHLGHLFQGENYGNPVNDRFCINSISVKLEPADPE
jgi:peptide-methionine (R)-S-oxide reductase